MNRPNLFFIIVILAGLSLSIQKHPSASESYRVAVIHYQHETCTFCPGGDTETEDWSHYKPYLDGKEVLKTSDYIKGFVAKAKQLNGIKPVGIKSPGFVFGSSSRSWNSNESFEHFMNIITEDLKAQMPVQGVYLALHGALAVRGVPKPEAEIARRIREIVGDDVPIAASFDFHGNEDADFLKWANASFVNKEYPHTDSDTQGERAAEYLYKAMKGEYNATSSTKKVPIITATVLHWTGKGAAKDIMDRARNWEKENKDTYVNVFFGFPWADAIDGGATVEVITNNNQPLANSIATDMADYIWSVREEFAHGEFIMPKEAVKKTAEAIANNQTPVALGDYSDRPGDATWILQQLIDQKVDGVLYGCLTDAPTLEKMKEKKMKAGDVFDMEVGGYTGEQAGKPVHINGTVKFFGKTWSYDKVAVIDFGNHNTLIITPAYTQISSPEELKIGKINPDDYKVFVVKSRAYFLGGFKESGFAKTVYIVDAPGSWIGTTRLDALDYKHTPINKLYPFEK